MARSTISIYFRFGMIGTVFESIDVSSNSSQLVCHRPMKYFNVRLLVDAFRYARLVCNHEYKVSCAIGGLYRLACAIYPLQLTNLENITAVLVQYTVPIEENCWSLHFTPRPQSLYFINRRPVLRLSRRQS